MKRYGRKVSWNVKWYGKYRRKLWNDMENIEEIVKRYEKYGRKVGWIVEGMENMEEKVEMWNDMEHMEVK